MGHPLLEFCSILTFCCSLRAWSLVFWRFVSLILWRLGYSFEIHYILLMRDIDQTHMYGDCNEVEMAGYVSWWNVRHTRPWTWTWRPDRYPHYLSSDEFAGLPAYFILKNKIFLAHLLPLTWDRPPHVCVFWCLFLLWLLWDMCWALVSFLGSCELWRAPGVAGGLRLGPCGVATTTAIVLRYIIYYWWETLTRHIYICSSCHTTEYEIH